MKSHSIFIAEDSPGDKEALLVHIARYKDFRVDGSVSDGAQALAALRSKAYDLVFLDIDMPVLSGFEVLKSCGPKMKPYVIITSSYPSFAVEAFDFMAVDFLLKPYTKSRFDKAVDRYLVQRKLVTPLPDDPEEATPPRQPCKDCVLRIQGKGYLWIIPHNDILYLSSDERRTDIHCKNGDKVANLCLADILALLPEDSFCRIHRQYAVNRRYIAGLRGDFSGRQTLCLLDSDETELPVGRAYLDSLITILH